MGQATDSYNAAATCGEVARSISPATSTTMVQSLIRTVVIDNGVSEERSSTRRASVGNSGIANAPGNRPHLADNVVLLQYAGFDKAAVSRTLTVLKTRASSHDPRVREFEISQKGITLNIQPRP